MSEDYNVNYDGLSVVSAQYYADSGDKLDMVFACALDSLMVPREEALDWIATVVVFGETSGYYLDDWGFDAVGVDPGEDNVLLLRVQGYVREA